MSIHQGTRIAFMGAGGTGKTTSAQEISLALDLDQPKSASRQVYEENNLTEEKVLNMSGAEQLDLQTAIFKQKVENDQEFSYVTDRTILDHYAYCLAYCGGHMPNSVFRSYEEQTRVLMHSTYSHIFYFPWGYFDAPADGVRSPIEAWQSQIDALLVGYVFRWGLPVITVPQTFGGEHERDNFILKHVRGEDE